MNRLSWYEYAIKLAEVAALRSEDPYLKVGSCAIGHQNQVLSLGYNGAPPSVEIDWSNRDERRKRVLHSEVNCLKYCKPGEIQFIAVTTLPCSDCMKNLAAYNVKTVVFKEYYDKDSFAVELAKEFGIELIQIK